MIRKIVFGLLMAATTGAGAQTIELVEQSLDNPANTPRPCFPIPNERQMAWQETEFYAFFHYGMNTFTGKEWGYGHESESIYAPATLPDCEQWVQAAKDCGMRGGIAVVKHHDGFCLWPTATTTHNVTRGGGVAAQVNIPKQFAAASEKLGMKYGFYISPWDRNSAHYAKSTYVTEVFFKQVDEISKEAGNDQFEMWFDGANGGDGYYGGANETRSIDASVYYDRPNLYDHIHSLQPNCVVWGDEGEARWIGNERGVGWETQWSPNTHTSGYEGDAEGWKWWPNESDAKATSAGWFWHADETPISAERMYQMYLETVGRNATLILNMPPNRDGVLPEATVNSCKQMGKYIAERLTTNLAEGKGVMVSDTRTGGDYSASNMLDGDKTTYWATPDGVTAATVTIDLGAPVTCHYVMLMEYIRLGQRVKAFTVEYSADGASWQKVGAVCTTIGYKRIIPLGNDTANHGNNARQARYIRISITDSRACPLLHTVAVY